MISRLTGSSHFIVENLVLCSVLSFSFTSVLQRLLKESNACRETEDAYYLIQCMASPPVIVVSMHRVNITAVGPLGREQGG